jgi:prevent-host-death family protein
MNSAFQPHVSVLPSLPIQWQIQDAKNKFSQVVKAAASCVAQWVTVHGKPTAVVVSVEAYKKLTDMAEPQLSLSEALLCPGLISDDEQIVFERNRNDDAHRDWLP